MTTSSPAVGQLKSLYERMATERSNPLERARMASALTVPGLIPPDGFNSSQILPDPYQSVGARGVNNLAARMLLTSFPPNEPVFRFTLPQKYIQSLPNPAEAMPQVEKALSNMERTVQWSLETTGVRASAFEVIRHLLVGGNTLIYSPQEGGVKSYGIDKYVVKRSPSGEALRIILQEKIAWVELSPSMQAALAGKADATGKSDTEKVFSLHTAIQRGETQWDVWQEIEGIEVPNSRGTYPLKKCPWRALRYIIVSGEDYGRGMVEEYLGDLQTLESLTKAIVKAAAAASKVVFLVRPGSSTKAKDLNEAESGDFKQGNKDDVSCLQLEKYADMQVAMATRDTIKADLEQAFLLANSIRRPGERVTAEEIRMMANELESALGGVYSHLSLDMQLPIIQLEVARLVRIGELPDMPDGLLEPVITTGIEALGRNAELERMRAFLSDVGSLKQVAEAASPWILMEGVVRRLAANHNVDTEGLIPTREQAQQAQAQQAQTAMMDKLGGPMVNQAGGIMKEQIKTAAQKQPQGGNQQ